MAALQLFNLRPVAPTTPGGLGSLQFDLLRNIGPATAVVNLVRLQSAGDPGGIVWNNFIPVPAANIVVPNLLPGQYDLSTYNVYDASDTSGAIITIPVYVPAPRGGCTDPDAANYDPTATFEDGSCQYGPPPVPTPVFDVPLLNALRFVQVAIPDGVTTFETADNTLFCQQHRPGQQLRPQYFQPVAAGDPVSVQVLTNYPNVEAIIHRHRDGVALATQPLPKVQMLQGPSLFQFVALSSDGNGNTRLIIPGAPLPPSLRAATRVSLLLVIGGTPQIFRVLRSGQASVSETDDFLILNRPWAELPGGNIYPGMIPAVSWELTGPFNVWQRELDLSGLPAGDYEIRLHGYDADNHSATAISEPIRYASTQPDTVVVEYRNQDNAFGMVFNTGITPRLRVPGTFFRQKLGGSITSQRNSDGTAVTLASTAQRLITFETYQLPAYLHEKLAVACRLDLLRLNGLRCQTETAYEATEVRQYPLSSGRVSVEQVDWLGAGNSDDAGPNDTGDDFLVLRVGGFVKLRGR